MLPHHATAGMSRAALSLRQSSCCPIESAAGKVGRAARPPGFIKIPSYIRLASHVINKPTFSLQQQIVLFDKEEEEGEKVLRTVLEEF